MPKAIAQSRFKKLVDDISTLYLDAREVQIQFAWKTGRRIVEEEQNGEMRAKYGASLLQTPSEIITEKCRPGFFERTS